MLPRRAALALGVGFIALGVLLLLQNFAGVPVGPEIIPAAFLLLVALYFWTRYERAGAFGWLLLAFLFGFAGLAAGNSGAMVLPEMLFGPLFLWGVGLAFGLHWLQRRPESWGYLFIAGFGLTLGFTAFVGQLSFLGDIAGVVFFAGLTVTFLLLHARFAATGGLGWAKYLGFVSAILALVVLTNGVFPEGAGLLPGILFVGTGAFLVWHALQRQNKETGSLGSA